MSDDVELCDEHFYEKCISSFGYGILTGSLIMSGVGATALGAVILGDDPNAMASAAWKGAIVPAAVAALITSVAGFTDGGSYKCLSFFATLSLLAAMIASPIISGKILKVVPLDKIARDEATGYAAALGMLLVSAFFIRIAQDVKPFCSNKISAVSSLFKPATEPTFVVVPNETSSVCTEQDVEIAMEEKTEGNERDSFTLG